MARTSPGLGGPFQSLGGGKWRSTVATRSSRCSVAHNTGRSATTSTCSKRGSVVFIPAVYPPLPFPKTTPNMSEPPGEDCPRLAAKVRVQTDRVCCGTVLLYPEGVLVLNSTGAAVV